MMAGTASLPHILMRYFTTPSVRAARKSVGWSLFFIFLLYFTAPALATLTKLQLLDPTLPTAVIGQVDRGGAEPGLGAELDRRGHAGGPISNGDGSVQLNEFFMRPDIVVLATPEIAGSALRDLRPGGGRRHGGGDVDRRRAAARHRQRAQP